ncbi:hypothetical protein DP124_01250 [Clostridium tetani]|uniref:hypothetical protein n=1 Tax=Clostridium tetani TaxID=1513 RepID=UPI00100AB616|nr:hypothetical protein [Clostridium tetani]RXI55525.1 hypothetical protein DP124_01250 [Clostridium tetani]RXM70822.1 hypothetical protein DP143_13715 [Clostridium tetani]
MFERATVTMPYKELKELLDENKKYKEKLGKIKDIENMKDEEFEADPFKKGLDEIFDLLEKASKQTRANEKQYFIYKSMKTYCDIFEIPTKELLEDISKGVEPK